MSTRLICTDRLVYELDNDVVFLRATYWDGPWCCFGSLLSVFGRSPGRPGLPLALVPEWLELMRVADRMLQRDERKARGK